MTTHNVRHPNYTQSKVYFDVAIIEMDKPVEFSFTIHPICLPKKPNTDIDSIKNIPATLSGTVYRLVCKTLASLLSMAYFIFSWLDWVEI